MTEAGSGTLRAIPRARRRGRAQWDVLLVIAAGGALGSVSRYALALALPHQPGSFAVATLLANVTGCLAIGVLTAVITEAGAPHRLLRPFVGIGFLGGFTTLSTFVVDALGSVRAGNPLTAAGYLTGSVLACLLAVAAGLFASRAVLTRRGSAGGR